MQNVNRFAMNMLAVYEYLLLAMGDDYVILAHFFKIY